MTVSMEVQEKIESLEAEGGVLGSMILDPCVIPQVRGLLAVDDLYREDHRTIFEGILAVADRQAGTVDLIGVRDELTRRGTLQKIGGVLYLMQIVESVPSAANAEYYAEIVRERAQIRRMLEIGKAIPAIALEDGPATATERWTEIEKLLREAVGDGIKTGVVDVRQTINTISLEDDEVYVPSGFEALDRMIYGLGQGDMIVIAGRPGMGKTGFMLNLARNISETGRAVLFVSLEMTAKQLQQRLLSMIARVDLAQGALGYLHPGERQRVEKARETITRLPILIDCPNNLTIDKLRSTVASIHRRYGLGAVFVDYLQRMATPPRKSRYEAITDVSAGLKDMAVAMEIPFIVGCQLNRDVEKRDDRRPKMSDLRDSGGIEQDADVIAMLYRTDYYQGTITGDAELIVGKNRRGKTGTIGLAWAAEYLTFAGLPQ